MTTEFDTPPIQELTLAENAVLAAVAFMPTAEAVRSALPPDIMQVNDLNLLPSRVVSRVYLPHGLEFGPGSWGTNFDLNLRQPAYNPFSPNHQKAKFYNVAGVTAEVLEAYYNTWPLTAKVIIPKQLINNPGRVALLQLNSTVLGENPLILARYKHKYGYENRPPMSFLIYPDIEVAGLQRNEWC